MEPTAKKGRVRRVAAAIVVLAVVIFGLIYVGVAVATADRLTRPTNRPLSIDPRGSAATSGPGRPGPPTG